MRTIDAPQLPAAEVLPALQGCARAGVPAMVLSPDVGVCCRGRFSAASSDGVVLELLFDWAAAVFMPLSLCCVTFNAGGRAHVFLASVRDYDIEAEQSPLPRLVLQLPSQVVAIEARRTVRVPVTPSAGLTVQVATPDNRVWVPQPRDVSLIGILAEFSPASDPDLAIGANVVVELQREGVTAQLTGVVRRRHRGNYGIFFAGVMSARGDIEPPDSLANIVSGLERQYFAVPRARDRGGADDML